MGDFYRTSIYWDVLANKVLVNPIDQTTSFQLRETLNYQGNLVAAYIGGTQYRFTLLFDIGTN
jgi:hypothetical protein